MRIGPAADVARVTIPETIPALWEFSNASGISLDDIVERTLNAGVTIDGQLIKDAAVAGYGKLAVAAVVTALWEFAHSSGLKTDVILERTAAAGVTIDGVKLVDIAVQCLGLAAVGSQILASTVSGDSTARWQVTADGAMSWGPGNAARDTNLYRSVANVLKTDDALHIAGTLTALGQLYWSYASIGLSAGSNDDVDPGAKAVVRITAGGGGRVISGFSGGVDGRVLVVINIGSDAFTLENQEADSIAANRIILASASDEIISPYAACHLWYDGTSARWRNTSIQS